MSRLSQAFRKLTGTKLSSVVGGSLFGSADNPAPQVTPPPATTPPAPDNTKLYLAIGAFALIAVVIVLKK